MSRLIEETDQVIKLNLRQLVIFKVLFRLIVSTFHIRLVNQLLGFSSRMTGYSYLTINNMETFLLRLATTICALIAAVLDAVLMVVEIGGLVTAYQSAAHSMRTDSVYILEGTLDKAWDAYKGRDWRFLPLALADYPVINSYLLLRALTRIKPLNLAMYEILHASAARLGLVLLAAALMFIGIPTMLMSFVCMIEQKQFGDGFRRSMELLKGRSLRATVLLVVVNLGLAVGLTFIYVVTMVISAIIVTLFVDGYAAMAVLPAVCARLELMVLLIGGILVPSVDSGTLTVIYYQYGMKNAHGAPQDFTMPYELHLNRKWILTITGALVEVGLFLTFNMTYNGISPDWDVLEQARVTTHRGNSRMALENTMVAIEAAMEEMADYSEIDVQITVNDIVVVCHDLSPKRVAGVDRRLETMTYDQVSRLGVGSHFSPRFVGKCIPTLEEVLEACKGRMKLNIESKNIGDDSSPLEQTAALVRKYRMGEQCVITSAKLEHPERVEEMAPEPRAGYIPAVAYGTYYDNKYIDLINIRSSFVDKKLVEAIHEEGKAAHVWTMNSRTEIE